MSRESSNDIVDDIYKYCNTSCNNDCQYCIINRNYLNSSAFLRAILGKIQQRNIKSVLSDNSEEKKYEKYGYSGSFTKGLQHNNINGQLADVDAYINLVNGILNNDQIELANVQMAQNYQMKLVDPLASLSSVLIGSPQYLLFIDDPPKLSSNAGAAEMVELYAQYLCRDVPFIEYSTDSTIQSVLANLNISDVLSNLQNLNINGQITQNLIFRGISDSERYGPYISQLLLLNVPMGALVVSQQYNVPPTKNFAIANNFTVDFGRNVTEQINIQNTTLSNLPGPIPVSSFQKKYIYSGRALAEVVHNDMLFQFSYQSAQILLGLGVSLNPGFPSYPNQQYFIAGPASPTICCAIAEAAELAVKHSWFWKWQVYRKLRPEAFGLDIDNVLNSRLPNDKFYDISNIILNNNILNDVKSANGQYNPEFNSSYTLPSSYREGAPLHPSYPAGHGVIIGASITILKIFLDTDKPWLSLPGLQPNFINRTIIPNSVIYGVAQSDPSGNTLIDYTDIISKNNMTINGELNKLATNVVFGRTWAGIHYRSDAIQGILLGEQIAVKYMEDLLSTMVQNNLDGSVPVIEITGYAGNKIIIKQTFAEKIIHKS
jgi:hypothetical protein